MRGYIEQVVRYASEQLAMAEASRALRCRPLPLKIQHWWNLRHTPTMTVSMEELVREFNTSPGLIGNALHHLGWQRKRSWGNGGYRRYWVAPDSRAAGSHFGVNSVPVEVGVS